MQVFDGVQNLHLTSQVDVGFEGHLFDFRFRPVSCSRLANSQPCFALGLNIYIRAVVIFRVEDFFPGQLPEVAVYSADEQALVVIRVFVLAAVDI